MIPSTINLDFVRAMDREIQANSHKGDWFAWQPSKAILVAELDNHLEKLKKALLEKGSAGVNEHTADCANLLMKMHELYAKGHPLYACTKCGQVAERDLLKSGEVVFLHRKNRSIVCPDKP